MNIFRSIKRLLSANNKNASEIFDLDRLFSSVCAGEISENDFIDYINNQEIPPEWVLPQLTAAYAKKDEIKISFLVTVIRQQSFRSSKNTAAVISLFCKIMEDPQCYPLAEEIADALGYCELTKENVRSLINFCISPIWLKYDYADMRKAFESIYAGYQQGACTKSEAIAAFQEIIDSPNTQDELSGLRSTAQGFIEKIELEV